MNRWRVKAIVFCLWLVVVGTADALDKHRILVVSSYHREYLWSQDTQAGLCQGLIEFGFLENEQQAVLFTATDNVDGERAVIKKLWMDTKRRNEKKDIVARINEIMATVDAFQPDVVLLGDDNATNYIGNQLIDTDVPVVFWGVNGRPLKYGLLDSLETPGHNITGVYQAGYPQECLDFLKRIVPDVKTVAILSDDSPTGRSKAKQIQRILRGPGQSIELVGTVITNSFAQWKQETLDLEGRVDAFFVLNHNSLKDDAGHPVDQLTVGAWYLQNIQKPECAHERQFVEEGMLSVCDDSGYNQGHAAAKLAYRILVKKEHPGSLSVRAPGRGPFIVNGQRARMLGIELTEAMGIEETVPTALALKKDAEG